MNILKKLLLAALMFTLIFAAAPFKTETATAKFLSQSKISGGLLETIDNTLTPQEVIVTFKTKERLNETHSSLLNHLGIKNGVLLNELPIAGVIATPDQIKRLAADDRVLSIYPNRKLQYENETATDFTHVDQVRTDSSFMKKNGGFPVDGNGIGVVVNDSGVDGLHPDLQYGSHLVQNVAAQTNLNALTTLLPITYAENVPNTDTTGGHGTHVAGIVGATGAMSGGKYEGVAPGADLIGYGSGAGIAILDVVGGFDYALTHQAEYNIRVITNSWGDTSQAGAEFDPNDPINIATKKLYDRGIVTVFSAGNSGPDMGTISGNYKKAPWVVTVAAGDAEGNLTDFSSRGIEGKTGTVTVDGETWTWEDRPTVTAPGYKVISTRTLSPTPLLGATDDIEMIEPGYLPYYTTMSGTSMAAPHVAGVIALMLDANPELTPLQVKEILQQTATPMDVSQWEAGAGYVNAYEAVMAAFSAQ
ncbi:S8 family serine peptidase [Chungangia koreensis]|uniref:S8 family serine peptidase n=1 Tax=Chungangia koreensis TaxID=752657 RepID=A0ABV8X655_9LACT